MVIWWQHSSSAILREAAQLCCPDHVMARATPSGLAPRIPLLCVGVVNLPIGQLTLDFWWLATCLFAAIAAAYQRCALKTQA